MTRDKYNSLLKSQINFIILKVFSYHLYTNDDDCVCVWIQKLYVPITNIFKKIQINIT